MSDNEDDRLDRAKRIRKMREGGGRQDEPDADESLAEDSESQDSETEESNSAESESEDSESQETGDDGIDNAGDEPDPGESADEDGAGTDTGEGEMDAGEDETDVEPDEETESTVTVPETADLEAEAKNEFTGEAENDIRAPLPDTEELEEALDSTAEEAESAAPEEVAGSGAAATSEALEEDGSTEEETRVLEFQLGDEYYCLDIDYIEEIVKEEAITRVPNTPEFVEGVVDLRGQITTILNPKVTIDKDDVTPGGLIIVFDSESFEDQGHIGWVVDDVRQVSPITENEVNEPPVEEQYINGVIDREEDEQFVIWTTPDMAMEEAE